MYLKTQLIKGKNKSMKTKNEKPMPINNIITSSKPINPQDEQYRKVMLIYELALKSLATKLNIIEEEFKNFFPRNPIDHISTRIKSPESILNKMRKKSCQLTYKDMMENINDIAGMRIVCSFENDIDTIIEILESFSDIEILKRKNYIQNVKESGYRSYHLLVNVPINFLQEVIYVKVEIQVRSIGMHFWASLEHQLKYKNNNSISPSNSRELVKYAKAIAKIDKNMLALNAKKE